MEILKFLEIKNTVRSLIEEEIHDGQILLKAVFRGKDLEIRLFKTKVRQNDIRTFGMYYLTQIFADYR